MFFLALRARARGYRRSAVSLGLRPRAASPLFLLTAGSASGALGCTASARKALLTACRQLCLERSSPSHLRAIYEPSTLPLRTLRLVLSTKIGCQFHNPSLIGNGLQHSAHALAVGGAQLTALVRARGGGAAVFYGPVEHVAARALQADGTGLLDDVLLYQHAELGIGIIGLYRIVRVHKLYVKSMNNECLYGLLHPLTELGGAAVVQAAAVGLHALAEGGHGLVLALDGVAGVGKGVEEQDHAPACGNAVVNGAGVAHPVVHKGYHHIGGIKGGGLGVPLHAKEQLSSASLRFSSFLIGKTQAS